MQSTRSKKRTKIHINEVTVYEAFTINATHICRECPLKYSAEMTDTASVVRNGRIRLKFRRVKDVVHHVKMAECLHPYCHTNYSPPALA